MRRVVRCVPPGYEPYRYTLDVALREDAAQKLAIIMKNPSTAGESRSDQTIGKVEAWTRRHSFGSVVCVNLFARRTTVPSALNGLPYSDIVGLENDRHILEAAATADVIVAAWGNPNGIARVVYDRRIGEVLRLLAGYAVHTVGPLTRDGYPRHGRMWNSECELDDERVTFHPSA